MTVQEEFRTISYRGTEIEYQLKRKTVKNLNLRIHSDSSIVVSANESISADKVDEFVIEKGAYILSTVLRFKQIEAQELPPKKFVSGETFNILGRGIRLKVKRSEKEGVFSDGRYLYLSVKNPDDYDRKEKMIRRYLDKQCRDVFLEIMQRIYPMYQKYGLSMPILRIRDMKTRWGSCSPARGAITLNKQLLEVPTNCIEYVVMHEFCHFIHPNHSKQFYSFLTMLMPDWKERKAQLDKSAAHGL